MVSFGEWVDHDGKGMPVDGNVFVSIAHRDGNVEGEDYFEGDYTDTAGFWHSDLDGEGSYWVHTGEGCDIVRYRIVTP